MLLLKSQTVSVLKSIPFDTMPFFRKLFGRNTRPTSSSTISSITSNASFTWTINNFSSLRINCGQCLYSPEFFDDFSQTKWKLQLYPNGICDKDRDWIAVYMRLISSLEDFEVQLQLSIVEHNGINRRESYVKRDSKKFKMNTWHEIWGASRFIKREQLLNNTSGLIIDDRLTIVCSFSTSKRMHDNSQLASEQKEVRSASVSGRKFQDAKVHEHDNTLPNECCNLTENLSLLLEEQRLSDVALVAADGKVFSAHKTILSARSPVFSAMFLHDMRENQENLVEIEDLDSNVLEQLLKFMYTGKIMGNLSSKMAEDLFVAADKYAVDGLRFRCESILASRLDENNVMKFLVLADAHGVRTLNDEAVRFITAHAENVIDSDKFKEVEKLHPQLIIEILRQVAKAKR